jgi:glycosyltransferase involved in cell wall biosynthesis
VPRTSLRIIPYGVDVKQFGPHVEPLAVEDEKRFTFLSIFDWSQRSGWDVLLRAYLAEFAAGEDVQLVIRASHLRMQELTALVVRELPRGGRPKLVILPFSIAPELMPRLYATADAFVGPSRGEGWGLRYGEAMASGLPTIATHWGGHLDFMNAENSYLIEYERTVPIDDELRAALAADTSLRWVEPSVDHLRTLMRRVFEHPEEARDKGRCARSTICQRVTWTQAALAIRDAAQALGEPLQTHMTAIGPVHLATDWPELRLAFRTRTRWYPQDETMPPTHVTVTTAPEDQIEAFAASHDAVVSAPQRMVRVMDGAFLLSRAGITGLVPERSYYAGTILDWLWLAIPVLYAPDGWEAIHAAAVAQGDNATLIVGRSGSGKTTVLLEFLRRGAALVSDDLVLVNGAARTARGWDLTLHMAPSDVGDLAPLSSVVDFAGKVRLFPDRFRQAPSRDLAISRVVCLSDDPRAARHDGWGFDTAWVPDHGAAARLVSIAEHWGPRPAELAARVSETLRSSTYPKVAVCTPFAGKLSLLSGWLAALRRAGVPENATLIWLSNTRDAEFNAALETAAAEFGARVLTSTFHRASKDETVARLWSIIRRAVPDECTYVVTLEDDVLPSPGGVAQLLDQAILLNGTAVVGVPVMQLFAHGHLAKMAWRIDADQSLSIAVQAPTTDRVDAVSLSLTAWPASFFRRYSFPAGKASGRTMGYDQLACLEASRAGLGIYAAWHLKAEHLNPYVPAGATPATSTVVLVGLGSHALADGPTWRVVGEEPEGALGDIARRHPEADILLYVGSGVRLTPDYVAAVVQAFQRIPNVGFVRGDTRVGADELPLSGAAGVRVDAASMVPATGLSDVQAHLREEGWEEVRIVGPSCCGGEPGRCDPEPPPWPSYDQAKPRVLFQNRHPWSGAQPGFGGDMEQLFGGLRSLRRMGVKADFRGVQFHDDYENWDIVHLYHTQFPWVRDFGWRYLDKRPLVVTAVTHGYPPLEEWQQIVERARLLLVYSPEEGQFYADRLPACAQKIRLHPMGVLEEVYEVGKLTDADNSPSVLCCGRYCDYKNQEMVLRACMKLDVPVAFAGPVDYQELVAYKERLMVVAGGWTGATFHGLVQGPDLWRLYQRAHVHVNAARFEPYGIVTTEAQALGCNIVHTQRSWAAGVFGTQGTLCDPYDLDSVTESIEQELRRPRGWAGIRPPTWQEASPALLGFYQEVWDGVLRS